MAQETGLYCVDVTDQRGFPEGRFPARLPRGHLEGHDTAKMPATTPPTRTRSRAPVLSGTRTGRTQALLPISTRVLRSTPGENTMTLPGSQGEHHAQEAFGTTRRALTFYHK